MAQGGDTITYTYSGSKETEDISAIDEIIVEEMRGAAGGSNNSDADDSGEGGYGGLIENYTFDVSNFSTLELWIGQVGAGAADRSASVAWGRAKSFGNGDTWNIFGGGSTELWTDSNSVFISAADAGGGAAANAFDSSGGGGGARGGEGGSGGWADGADAEGTGFGGDGGDGPTGDGQDGGQEINSNLVVDSGTTTTGGGSTDTHGEIQISYISTAPAAPTNVQITDDQTEDELTVDWDEVDGATGYFVYYAESSFSDTANATLDADVTAPPHTITGLEDGEEYFVRVSSHD